MQMERLNEPKPLAKHASLVRSILLLLPLAFYVSYRPGEMIILLSNLEHLVWRSRDNRIEFDPRIFEQAFGGQIVFSVVSFGIVSLGFGWFFGASKLLSLRSLAICSFLAITFLSIPVMAFRLRQVLDQWGYLYVLPMLHLEGRGYVYVQNICASLCGFLLITACLAASRVSKSTDDRVVLEGPTP